MLLCTNLTIRGVGKGFAAMSDRASVITYMGLLLRRMNEFTECMATSKTDITNMLDEAQSLQRRWDACMAEIRTSVDKKTNPDP
jgi:hypothetical protein